MEFWTYISACETRNLVWDLNFDREFQRNFNEASIRLREYCGSDLYPLQPRLKMLVPRPRCPASADSTSEPNRVEPGNAMEFHCGRWRHDKVLAGAEK